MKSTTGELSSIRQAFGDTIFQLGSKNPNLYVVSIGLRSSLCLDKFANKFKSRFIEAGIAENNATGIAAGLAKAGKKVILASFACFSPAINWAVIKQSICYQELPVVIVGSHTGLMSTDLGATHQMLEDVALMQTMPGMQVYAPLDATETKLITESLVNQPHPAYLRLVRPQTELSYPPKLHFTAGHSQVLRRGTQATIIGYGPILNQALSLDKKYSVDVINCSSLKPFDSDTIMASVKKTKKLICLEDHQANGGFGQTVAAFLASHSLTFQFIHLAVNDSLGTSAKDYQQLYSHYHLDQSALIKAIK